MELLKRTAASLLICILMCVCLAGCARDPGPEPVTEPDPPEPVIEVDDPPARVTSALTYDDVILDYFDTNGKTDVAVIVVGFTDGWDVDRELLEDMFCGERGDDDYIESVSAFYKYNSYGRDLFDFHFFYYDCGMTSDEAFRKVNDEKNSGYYANRFLYKAYDAVKKEHKAEFDAMDTDRDGYIECAWFVFADRTSDGAYLYGGAAGTTPNTSAPGPKVGDPAYKHYVKTEYVKVTQELEHGYGYGGSRVFVHEAGHLFGIPDYYDFSDYSGTFIDVLGSFDMHSQEIGDENSFSKFACGWLEPYFITPDIDSITIKLGNSSLNNEAVLIPVSTGWNGSAFDEYILIDVLAPCGASGFDWDMLKEEQDRYKEVRKCTNGGVRVLHVDARLVEHDGNYQHWHMSKDPYAIKKNKYGYAPTDYLNACSNGRDPYFNEEDRFCHIVDLIPSDGSSKIRLSTPRAWSIMTNMKTGDLFGPGDVFSMETCADAFPCAPYMNSGATLDYEVIVEAFNEKTGEAVITIRKTA